MATFFKVLIMAVFFTVALSETTGKDEHFPRCEFKLKGLPIPRGESDDQPADCYKYGPLERKAWEKENDKFDEFNKKLLEAELYLFKTNITFLLNDNETIQVVPKDHEAKMVSSTAEEGQTKPKERNEEVEAMDFEFRQILYHHINVFNKTEECQKWSEDVITLCDCLVEVRNDMITCLNDLKTCFNIVIQ